MAARSRNYFARGRLGRSAASLSAVARRIETARRNNSLVTYLATARCRDGRPRHCRSVQRLNRDHGAVEDVDVVSAEGEAVDSSTAVAVGVGVGLSDGEGVGEAPALLVSSSSSNRFSSAYIGPFFEA